jgi:hypothetical protein
MPQWLVIVLSALAGLVIVGGAVALAFLPELRTKPRPRKSWLAEPSGNVDDPTYPGVPNDGA